MKMKLALATVIALIFGLAVTLMAQHPAKNSNCNNEMFEQMEKYHEEKIAPQLKKWKKKIDKTISIEDKKELDKLREKAYKLQVEIKEEMGEICDDRPNKAERREKRKKMKKVKDKYKDKMEVLREETRDIIDKYNVLAKEIRIEATTFKKEVRKELEKKREEYREKRKSECDKEGKRGRKFGKGRRHFHKGHHGRKMLGEVGIWLYNGTAHK